jgi:hypothetical protein
MKLSINTKHPNYAAKVIRIEQLEKHPKADRLQLAVVDFQRVITGLDAKEGDLYVHFPAESQINLQFLAYSNAFRKKELNADKSGKTTGFFEEKGRVKSIKLREVISEGYIHPLSSVNDWLLSLGSKETIGEDQVGSEFDTIEAKGIDPILFTKKYFVPIKGSGKQKQQTGENRMVDGQFHLHDETKQLKRNLDRINPDSIISIMSKWHGACGVFSNILVKRKLSLIEKVAKFFGAKVVKSEYDYIWSSRRVVKNRVDGQELKEEDVWNIAASQLKGRIEKGVTLYCELVGQEPSGKWIQKNYDYGQDPTTCGVVVFRITHTDTEGKVREFSLPQMQNYCERYQLAMAPLFFYGKASEYYEPPIPAREEDEESLLRNWREGFLDKLKSQYTEKDCQFCENKVPEEGVVIRLDGEETFSAFKLKSLRFLEGESKGLDKGEVSADDEE